VDLGQAQPLAQPLADQRLVWRSRPPDHRWAAGHPAGCRRPRLRGRTRRWSCGPSRCRGRSPGCRRRPPPAHDFANLHHPHLPIGHAPPPFGSSVGRQAGVAESFRTGGGKFLKNQMLLRRPLRGR
jgi:hypothetical protein